MMIDLRLEYCSCDIICCGVVKFIVSSFMLMEKESDRWVDKKLIGRREIKIRE